MKVTNIIWDVDDDDEEVLDSLPNEVYIPAGMFDEDEISDWLSNEYGFCNKGFVIEYALTIGDGEFRNWMYWNFRIPINSIAPEMLENILEYAKTLWHFNSEEEAKDFLRRMLPHEIPDKVIQNIIF